MIEVSNVTKIFDQVYALDKVSVVIPEGSIFGVIGSNGAGKSTLLRIIAGVLNCDKGVAMVDGEFVYENPSVKSKLCFLSDTNYFPVNASIRTMADYYSIVYPDFNRNRFDDWVAKLNLETGRKLHTFSKGMKKQVSILLGICSETKYLLCDETFDGLDPAVRQTVKNIFASEMSRRNFTPILASHSLRELEDVCDYIGLLHEGDLLMSKDLDEAKYGLQKVQCVIENPHLEEQFLMEMKVIQKEKKGSLLTVIARGTKKEVVMSLEEKKPLFYDVLPLTLEEIFICETEVAGYDVKNLIL